MYCCRSAELLCTQGHSLKIQYYRSTCYGNPNVLLQRGLYVTPKVALITGLSNLSLYLRKKEAYKKRCPATEVTRKLKMSIVHLDISFQKRKIKKQTGYHQLASLNLIITLQCVMEPPYASEKLQALQWHTIITLNDFLVLRVSVPPQFLQFSMLKQSTIFFCVHPVIGLPQCVLGKNSLRTSCKTNSPKQPTRHFVLH